MALLKSMLKPEDDPRATVVAPGAPPVSGTVASDLSQPQGIAGPAHSTNLPRPAYTPITAPPGGLLATTVGTPMQPRPPIDPNQQRIDPYTGENDDVVEQMNRITSQNSPYMAQARAAGLATANRRGLINSSIAAGASEAEALKVATPLALQNSQNAASRNQARLQGTLTLRGQQMGIDSQEKMQGLQIASTEKMSASEIASREKVAQAQIASEEARLGRQLDATEKNQIRELATQQIMQQAQLGQQRELTLTELASRERMTQAQIASEEARLGRQLTATETNQIRELATQQLMQQASLTQQRDLTQQELASRERQAQAQIASEEARLGRQLTAQEQQQIRDIASRETLGNLDAATRLRQQAMSNLSDQQKATLAYYLDSNKIYANSLDNLYQNKDMPAPARDAAIQSFLALRNAGVDLPAIIFGSKIDWGTSAPPATSSQPAPVPTANVPVEAPVIPTSPAGPPAMVDPGSSTGLLGMPAPTLNAPGPALAVPSPVSDSATMQYDPATGTFVPVAAAQEEYRQTGGGRFGLSGGLMYQ